MSVYRKDLRIIIFNPAGVKGLASDNHVHLAEIIRAPPTEGYYQVYIDSHIYQGLALSVLLLKRT